MKSVTLPMFLTENEIDRAVAMKDRVRVRDEIIKPNMDRINQALGQENDPDYLAWAVTYVLTSAGFWT